MTIFGRLFDDNIRKDIWWQYWEGYLMTIFGFRWWRPPLVLWQCSLLQATRFVTRFFLQITHGNNLATSLHIIASVTCFFPGIWVKAMERLPAQSVGEHRRWDCAERSCHCPTHGCSQQGDCREDPWNPGHWSSSHSPSASKHLFFRWWRCYKHLSSKPTLMQALLNQVQYLHRLRNL